MCVLGKNGRLYGTSCSHSLRSFSCLDDLNLGLFSSFSLLTSLASSSGFVLGSRKGDPRFLLIFLVRRVRPFPPPRCRFVSSSPTAFSHHRRFSIPASSFVRYEPLSFFDHVSLITIALCPSEEISRASMLRDGEIAGANFRQPRSYRGEVNNFARAKTFEIALAEFPVITFDFAPVAIQDRVSNYAK